MTRPEGPLHVDVLSRLLSVARHLGASADLNEILSVIIDAMRDTLQADRATVFEYDAKTHELFTMVAHGVRAEKSEARDQRTEDKESPGEIRIPANAGLAGECAQTRSIINVVNAYADQRFNSSVDRQTGYRTESMLTIPLVGDDGELVGVAQVLNKRGGPFTAEDESIAEALAAHAAVAMRRGRLIEDRMVRQRLERDLELARRIQQSSFPAELPRLDRFDIAAWNEPADQTGGDVYDVVPRWDVNGHGAECQASNRAASKVNRVLLLMADATGHGVGPALSVTQLRSMLRMAVRLGAELHEFARQANFQLCEDLPNGRFITAWFGELDADQSTLTSFSAGQGPLLHFDAARDTFAQLDADSVPLGILEDIEPAPSPAIQMHAGDFFAVISDGIFEATDPGGKQFGAQRVMDSLRESRHHDAQAMIASLRRALERFCRDRPADDDRTAIIIQRRDA